MAIPSQSSAARTIPTGKPLQRISWTAKVKDTYDWWKQNMDYYIGQGNFTGDLAHKSKDYDILYQVYNNKFPLKWFEHITNPLNAQNASHTKYPAKIRPTGMLRTNLDLLLGEYPKRPFVYQVVNMGEDGYNRYLEGLNSAIQNNLMEHFLMVAQQSMQAAGQSFQQIPQDEELELPEAVRERFTSKYKDNLAIRGQRWMKRAVREYHIRQELLKMFKDWLIIGEAYSYKSIEQGNFVYRRIARRDLRFGTTSTGYVEDADWVVHREMLNVSEVVDKFYDVLSTEEWNSIEQRAYWSSPESMYTHLSSVAGRYSENLGKIPVYHVQWKGRRPIKYVEYTDPLTGQVQEDVLDEDVPVDESMRVIKTEWPNEVYEGWRIGDDIFARMRPVPVQRNAMNNFSTCKLSYNGKSYSDTHAENISVLEMGMPNAILYMITNFTLEKTIAKNKGKIALIDQNAIPQKDGWNEEKFFYYADALGYMLVNRNQMGVDKSFNQYTTLDMGLFDQIQQLILLRDSFKKDWDDLLGVNPQRKAQIGSSDGLGTTQQAIFQSSVITDMIFTLFEELTERDLQGILDFSRFINIDGVRGIYNADDFDLELLSIDPNTYASAELGLFVKHSAEEQQTLQLYKQQVQAMIQNGVKQSTILEIQNANNVAELMGKLKRLEEIEMEQAQANAENEHERAMEIEMVQERFKRLESLLKREEINEEWDRRDQNEMIKGEYTLFGFGGDGDNNDNGIPDAAEISKRIISQQQLLSSERQTQQKNAIDLRKHQDEMALEWKKLEETRKLRESKERIENKKAKVALKNKVSGER